MVNATSGSRPSAVLRTAIAVLALPALAAWWTAPGGDGGPAPASPPVDTVILYGPVTFASPTGNAQTYVEEFSTTVPAGAHQAIRIVNGAPDSTGRAGLLSVELNGVELIDSGFDESVGVLEVPVTFAATNTLQVMVAGVPGAHVSNSALAAVGEELTVYGPWSSPARAGPPKTVTEQFSRPANAEEPFTLIITNGNPDGSNRVSSGRVCPYSVVRGLVRGFWVAQ